MNLKNSGDSTGFEPMTSAMPVQCSHQLILGDPGAARWDGKKIRAKKSQERGEEPLGTEF